MTIFSVQSTIFIRASVALLSSNGLKRFSSASSFSSNPLYPPPLPKTKKRCFPIVSDVDIGGVTIGRNDDDPTNNVPDYIVSKLGMQLHRRDKHPIGIIKRMLSTTTSSPITLKKTEEERSSSSLSLLGKHALKLCFVMFCHMSAETLVFETFEDLSPIVTTKQNFDDVQVPADHVNRSLNDTYYVDS
ncbi:hypothetical protein YC2023_077922 [Brassica napus]